LKGKADEALLKILDEQIAFYNDQLTPVSRKLIQNWPNKIAEYQKDNYEYTVREKIISQPMTTTSLSGTRVPKVVLPKYKDWGDILKWQAEENVAGHFPFTAGVFPLKEKVKTLPGCLQVKADPKEPTNAFTM
jgi:methylmalonyl-CoA mutase